MTLKMFLAALEMIQTEPQKHREHVFTVLSSTGCLVFFKWNLQDFHHDGMLFKFEGTLLLLFGHRQ